MTKADYQFFEDYADDFRRRHNYTGHRTVYLRHQTLEAVTVLHSLLMSFPKKEQTLAHLREFAARMGTLREQQLLSAPTEREKIHGRLWAKLVVDESVLARIFSLRRR